mgnify:CR=1 FL=1
MPKGTARIQSDKAVEVLCLSVSPPLIHRGTLAGREGGRLDILLDGESDFQPGMRVAVAGRVEGALRVLGTVSEIQGRRVRIETARVIPEEKRAFPRMPGGIRVRYLVLSGEEVEKACRSWMSGKDVSWGDTQWREPDPFMDFSVSGLRFEDERACQVGNTVLVELQVPGAAEAWRAVARVVRVEPLDRRDAPAESGGESAGRLAAYAIAVHFTDLPAAAREALGAFTLRIQNALLGIA